MNAKNYALFFDEESKFDAVVTLTDENGNSVDLEVFAHLAIEELQKEYIAAMPVEPNDEFDEGEALLLIYSEDEAGNPVFDNVNDPEEFEIVSSAFDELLEQMSEDDDEEDDDSDYLDDIEDIIPGMSIKMDK